MISKLKNKHNFKNLSHHNKMDYNNKKIKKLQINKLFKKQQNMVFL